MYFSESEEEDDYYSDANSDDSHSDPDGDNNSADEEKRKIAVAAHEKQQQLKSARELEHDTKAINDREDPQKSAMMWMGTLATEECFTFFEHGQYYAFSTSWQLEQALNYGDIVIIDRMSNVFGPYSFLYTLLVVNSEADTAIPVSYFLTKSGKTTFLSSWISAFAAHIKEKLDVVYIPKVAFTKCGDVSFNTAQSMFSESRVLYCNSQTDLYAASAKISRIVKRPFREHDFDTPKQKRSKRRKAYEAVKEFEKLMKQQDLVTASDSLHKFRQKWRNTNMLEYVEKHYFAEKESWLYAYRQGIPCGTIVGSGHSVAWQSSLREHLVKDFEQTREDRVIYSLARQTEMTFRGSTRATALPAFDRRNLDAAQMKAEDPSRSLVSALDCNTLRVKSFVSSSKYEIAIDPLENRIFSCSCPDFANRRRECKHILLVIAERPNYYFQLRPAFTKPSAGVGQAQQKLPALAQSALASANIGSAVQASIPSSEVTPKPNQAILKPDAPTPASGQSVPKPSNPMDQVSYVTTIAEPIPPHVAEPARLTQVTQKRSVGELEQHSPIVIDTNPLPETKPAGTSTVVTPVKVALIKEALAVIGKVASDLSTGEEILATLALAITLADRAADAQGSLGVEVQEALAHVNALLDKGADGQGKKRRLE